MEMGGYCKDHNLRLFTANNIRKTKKNIHIISYMDKYYDTNDN